MGWVVGARTIRCFPKWKERPVYPAQSISTAWKYTSSKKQTSLEDHAKVQFHQSKLSSTLIAKSDIFLDRPVSSRAPFRKSGSPVLWVHREITLSSTVYSRCTIGSNLSIGRSYVAYQSQSVHRPFPLRLPRIRVWSLGLFLLVLAHSVHSAFSEVCWRITSPGYYRIIFRLEFNGRSFSQKLTRFSTSDHRLLFPDWVSESSTSKSRFPPLIRVSHRIGVVVSRAFQILSIILSSINYSLSQQDRIYTTSHLLIFYSIRNLCTTSQRSQNSHHISPTVSPSIRGLFTT